MEDQASEPLLTETRLAITINRKLFAFYAVLFGAATLVGVEREVAAGSVVMTLMLGLGCGGICAFYVRGLSRRGPAIILDRSGIRDRRSGRAAQWASVSQIVVRRRRGAFGEHHHLVLILNESTAPTEELDVPIDMLALSWTAVVEAVEERAHIPVIAHHDRSLVPRVRA